MVSLRKWNPSQLLIYSMKYTYIYWILDLEGEVHSIWNLWRSDLQECKGDDFFKDMQGGKKISVGSKKSRFLCGAAAPARIYLPQKDIVRPKCPLLWVGVVNNGIRIGLLPMDGSCEGQKAAWANLTVFQEARKDTSRRGFDPFLNDFTPQITLKTSNSLVKSTPNIPITVCCYLESGSDITYCMRR